jgi:hypothetical protein
VGAVVDCSVSCAAESASKAAANGLLVRLS